MKYKKYSQLTEIITNHYILTEKFSRDHEGSIALFRFYPRILEDVQPGANNQKFTSYTGHLLKKRANLPKISFDNLLEADLLIALIDFAHKNKKQYSSWFPATLPYLPHQQLEFIKRLKSKNYFDSVKVMYSVSSAEEMKTLLVNFSKFINSSSRMGFSNLHFDDDMLEEIAKY